MKKILFLPLTILTFVFVTIFGIAPIHSQITTDQTIFSKNCEANNDSDFCKQVRSERAQGNRIIGPNGILTRMAQIFVYLTGAISVIMIIIGGFRYVLSGGDSNATKGAKDTIMYAVIGLVVAMFSQMIVSYVLSKL